MIRLLLLFLVGIILAVSTPRLFNKAPAGLLQPITADSPADHTYTLRARVDALPSVKRPYLDLHHEALPGFKNQQGEVIGMNEMVMGFPYLAPGVSLDGLAPGDPVEFTMEMRFTAKPRFLITRLTELPADTKLNLGTLEE
ncbi:MAG TPA: copper-binding protein [Phycisphaerales bacterium]|nr:copper-binding protein [Phycisphaerales bacterium]